MPTVTELKAELKARGLSTNGKKSELEARLYAALSSTTNNKRQYEQQLEEDSKRGRIMSTNEQVSSSSSSSSSLNNKKRKNPYETIEDDQKKQRMEAELFFNSLSNGQEQMTAEHTLAFCELLEIDPEDILALGLSFSLGSTSMGVFPKSNFVDKATELKITNIQSLKEILPQIQRKTSYGGSQFDETYKFAFFWGCDPGIRNLKKEIAIGLWKLLIPRHAFTLIDAWLKFWEERPAKIVTKDEWLSFRRFIVEFQKAGGLQRLQIEEAWPLSIEEFVEKLKKN